jgi:DNA-directed RNA polymerase III subunit RPC4
MREEKLYLFQFPAPFPTFSSKMTDVPASDQIPEVGGKKVSFTADTKLDASSSLPAPSEPKVELITGVIGRLEIYRSGTVKIRLANDILLNVKQFFHLSDFADGLTTEFQVKCCYTTFIFSTGS